jgi:nucleoside-diphosphate-sugar epimerase
LTTPRRPANYYGICKSSLFEVLSGYAEHTDLSLAWARIFFLYGPHEPEGRLIPLVIQHVLRGEPALCSHGSQIRDYLYIEDAAEALVTILDSELQGPINVASGEPITIRDLVTRAAGRLGRPDLIRLGAMAPRPTDVPLLLADTSRLRAEVGWQPRVTLEQGLDRTIEFWRGQLFHKSHGSSSKSFGRNPDSR